MAEEIKKLSFDELVAQIKDPAMLHALAAKHGLKVVGQGEEKKVALEVKKKDRPKIEIPEDADMPTMIKALNKGLNDLSSFMDENVQESKLEVKHELRQSKEQETSEKVRKFAKDKKDFEELIPMIEPFFNTGKYTIEEAYELGRKASGKGVEGKGETKETSKESPTRMSKSSENTDDIPIEKAKPLNVRDSVKKNLAVLLKDVKLGEDPTKDDDEV
jgi:hypothetical protein